MHICITCDALCDCNGDTGGAIHHDPVATCSHCALRCAHGNRVDAPCQFCKTEGLHIDEDAPPPPPGSAI
jgi:hypothetical protein